MTYPAEMVEGIRSIRDRVHEGVLNVFEHYKGSTGTDFDHWLDHELAAGGEAMIQARALYERRLYEMAQRGEFSWEGIYRSNGLDRFNLLMEVLGKGTGHTPDSLLGRLREFLTSSAFRDAPSNRIEALMWAVIAHRAANGQRRPPNRGMINDISVVSSLLPYCDAMFIDNECRGLLANIPVRHRPTYATRLFSRNNSDDFLSYLREIETNADSAILACVRSVYGDDWPKPYLTIYEETRRGRG
jgi:hypothetical protein